MADKVEKTELEIANEFIEKLKNESAQRRIENTKLKDSLAENEKNISTMTTTMNDVNTKLAGFETAAQKKLDADKSENELLSKKIVAMEGAISQATADSKALEVKLKKKESYIATVDRNTLSERLLNKLKYNFSSDYERKGLMAVMSEKADGKFVMNDEEVILKVKDFVKENKKADVKKTPQAGDQTKHMDVPVAEEITALLGKDSLTEADNKRLDELLVLAD